MKTPATVPPLVIELLEPKVAPAGTVIASIAGGVLTLTGDTLNNLITVTETLPDHFTIVGTAGTLIKLGAAAPVANVEFDGQVDAIKVDLKDGNDEVTLTTVSVTKDVTISQGLGNNVATLADLNLGGNLLVLGGSGADTVAFNGTLLVGGNAALTLGDGANSVTESASQLTVLGALNYTGGTAVDTLGLTPTGSLQLGSIAVNLGINAGSATFNAGTSLVVGGAVSLTSLDHASAIVSFGLGASFQVLVGGVLTVKNGVGDNNLSVTAGEGVRIGGAVSVTNGLASTSSSVIFTSPVLALEAGVTIKNGNGVFTNSLNGGLDVTGNVVITNGNSGAGTTTNSIAGNAIDISGGLKVVNGSGTYNSLVSAGDVALGGGILFSTAASGGLGATTNFINALVLDCASVTFTNGAGRFTNQLSANDGRITGNVAITTGDATGTVDTSVGVPSIGGSLTIKNGNGDFTNSITSSILHVGGNLSVTNGTASTSISTTISGTLLDVDGGVSIKNGDGNVSNAINASVVDIRGSLVITNGSTSGTVANNLGVNDNFRVGGNVSLVNGNGVFTTTIGGGSAAVFIGGNLSMLNGSHSSLTASTLILQSLTMRIGGGVTVKTLAGATTVQMPGQDGTIGGAVNVTTGDGNDMMEIFKNGTLATGAVNLAFGNGFVNALLAGNTGLSVKGSVTYSSLGSSDFFQISGPGRVTGGVNVNFGAGNGTEFYLTGALGGTALEVLGTVSVNLSGTTSSSSSELRNVLLQSSLTFAGGAGSEELHILDSAIRGKAIIGTGDAGDLIQVENSFFSGTLSVATGAGNDFVNIEANAAGNGSTFAKPVTIFTGDDNDSIIIAGPAANRRATFSGGLAVDGGNGTDTFTDGTFLVGTVTEINIP